MSQRGPPPPWMAAAGRLPPPSICRPPLIAVPPPGFPPVIPSPSIMGPPPVIPPPLQGWMGVRPAPTEAAAAEGVFTPRGGPWRSGQPQPNIASLTRTTATGAGGGRFLNKSAPATSTDDEIETVEMEDYLPKPVPATKPPPPPVHVVSSSSNTRSASSSSSPPPLAVTTAAPSLSANDDEDDVQILDDDGLNANLVERRSSSGFGGRGIKVNLLSNKPRTTRPPAEDETSPHPPPTTFSAPPTAPKISSPISWEYPTPLVGVKADKLGSPPPCKRAYNAESRRPPPLENPRRDEDDDDDDGEVRFPKPAPSSSSKKMSSSAPPPPPMISFEDTIPLMLGGGDRGKDHSPKRKRRRSREPAAVEEEENESQAKKANNFEADYQREFSSYFRKKEEEEEFNDFQKDFAASAKKSIKHEDAAALEDLHRDFAHFSSKKKEEAGGRRDEEEFRPRRRAKRTFQDAPPPEEEEAAAASPLPPPVSTAVPPPSTIELSLPKPRPSSSSSSKRESASKRSSSREEAKRRSSSRGGANSRISDDDEDAAAKDASWLPEGWSAVEHSSGYTLYSHHPSGVATLSRPYLPDDEDTFFRHTPPLAALPFLNRELLQGTEDALDTDFREMGRVLGSRLASFCMELKVGEERRAARDAAKNRKEAKKQRIREKKLAKREAEREADEAARAKWAEEAKATGKIKAAEVRETAAAAAKARAEKDAAARAEEARVQKEREAGAFEYKLQHVGHPSRAVLKLRRGMSRREILVELCTASLRGAPSFEYMEGGAAEKTGVVLSRCLIGGMVAGMGFGKTKVMALEDTCAKVIRKLEPELPLDAFDVSAEQKEAMRERMKNFYGDRAISDSSLIYRWSDHPDMDEEVKVEPKHLLAALLDVSESDLQFNIQHQVGEKRMVVRARVNVPKKDKCFQSDFTPDIYGGRQDVFGEKEQRLVVELLSHKMLVSEFWETCKTWWDAVNIWIDKKK